MSKFKSLLERNLTIVVCVLGIVILTMAITWGLLWSNCADESSEFQASCPVVQYFSVNNVPILPGNYRDLKINYPVNFTNVPQHVMIEVSPIPLSVAPPASLIPVVNGSTMTEVIAYRNDYMNFSLTSFTRGLTAFIGSSCSPQNISQNTGKWAAINCTETSIHQILGNVDSKTDQINWGVSAVVASIDNVAFTKMVGPVMAIGYNTYSWFGVDSANKHQLEVMNTVNSTLVTQLAIGPKVTDPPINVLGFQDVSAGSRLVVVWPQQVVSYHFDTDLNTWKYKPFWTATGTETCLAGAFTHDSSVYDVVLMIRTGGVIASYVNYTHTIASQDNTWTKNGEVKAPIDTTDSGNLFVKKASGTGDFFIGTSAVNIVYISRIPQTWNDVSNFQEIISNNVLEISEIENLELFGINETLCIIYKSSGSSAGVHTVGVLSFEDTKDNKEITMMNNVRKNFTTEELDVSVSSISGVDSLILCTPSTTANVSEVAEAFPLVATVNVSVLAIE